MCLHWPCSGSVFVFAIPSKVLVHLITFEKCNLRAIPSSLELRRGSFSSKVPPSLPLWAGPSFCPPQAHLVPLDLANRGGRRRRPDPSRRTTTTSAGRRDDDDFDETMHGSALLDGRLDQCRGRCATSLAAQEGRRRGRYCYYNCYWPIYFQGGLVVNGRFRRRSLGPKIRHQDLASNRGGPGRHHAGRCGWLRLFDGPRLGGDIKSWNMHIFLLKNVHLYLSRQNNMAVAVHIVSVNPKN